MAININQKHEKEIVSLSTFEAVRLRPTMYLGQVAPMEDKLPLIVDGVIKQVDKTWSPGFMHLIIEILENAIDEAKRCKGKMKNIHVTVNLDTNEVTIQDEGQGFHDAAKKHKKTKKNVVRTALEDIHSGSNFTDTSTNILGTHGVGSAIVNILSKSFTALTVNKTDSVYFAWDDYKVIKEDIRKKQSSDKLGTTISFIPSNDVFGNMKWDKDLISTYLSYKSFLITNDPVINKLKLNGQFILNGQKFPIEIIENFMPQNHITLKTKLGTIFMWGSYENSSSISFVNGSQCTGIHQKVVQDWVNDYFKYPYAHHFYETLISLNVPSQLMRFADQNKTKYAVNRGEIEIELENDFKTRLLNLLKTSSLTKEIEKNIEDRLYEENIKKIRRAQKTSKRKISDKYSPASKTKNVIYITEGLSAAGSVKQARDSETEAVYALKGKIKNTKRLSDLTDNKEILEIMSILGIEPSSKQGPTYKKIVIATDEDPDGQHISSLIINLFNKWFPHIIEDCKLYRLVTPLVVCNDGSKRKYFYSLEDFNNELKIKKLTNINYLKGLGSLSIEDWQYVMDNKMLFSITNDRSATKYLEIAFGDSSNKRKKWLEGKAQ